MDETFLANCECVKDLDLFPYLCHTTEKTTLLRLSKSLTTHRIDIDVYTIYSLEIFLSIDRPESHLKFLNNYNLRRNKLLKE